MYRILPAVFLISVLNSIARNVSSIESQTVRSNCPDEPDKWPCRSGACIPIHEVCDGIKHCRDSSDENVEVCGGTQCTAASFRCAYGACISIERVCDGVDDCLDSSDEEREICLKRRLDDEFREEAQRKKCAGFGQMKCWSGQCVGTSDKCNGRVDCDDESDEWPNLCAQIICDKNTQFQCSYGACVDLSAKCNGTAECADKSDEAVELCELANKSHETTSTDTTTIPDITEVLTTKTTTENTTEKVFRKLKLHQRYNKYLKTGYCPHQWIDQTTDCCTLYGSKVSCRNILPNTIVHKDCKLSSDYRHQCTEERKWVKFGS